MLFEGQFTAASAALPPILRMRNPISEARGYQNIVHETKNESATRIIRFEKQQMRTICEYSPGLWQPFLWWQIQEIASIEMAIPSFPVLQLIGAHERGSFGGLSGSKNHLFNGKR